jgi:hypothetical protein
MPLPIAPKITQAGLAAAIAANGLGTSLQLTHIALGTSAYNPVGTETGLVAEILRVAIGGGTRPTPTKIQVAALFQAATGQSFVAREIGFFAGTTLFAVASVSATPGPALNFAVPDSYQLGMQYALELNGVPPGSVNITVDPLQSVALAALLAHNADPATHTDIRALITTEAETRLANDNTEIAARAAAITTQNNSMTSAVNNEANERAAADTALQNQIAALAAALPWNKWTISVSGLGTLSGMTVVGGSTHSSMLSAGGIFTIPAGQGGKWRFSGISSTYAPTGAATTIAAFATGATTIEVARIDNLGYPNVVRAGFECEYLLNAGGTVRFDASSTGAGSAQLLTVQASRFL